MPKLKGNKQFPRKLLPNLNLWSRSVGLIKIDVDITKKIFNGGPVGLDTLAANNYEELYC